MLCNWLLAFSHGVHSSCSNILAYIAVTIFRSSDMEGDTEPVYGYYSENETEVVEHCGV